MYIYPHTSTMLFRPHLPIFSGQLRGEVTVESISDVLAALERCRKWWLEGIFWSVYKELLSYVVNLYIFGKSTFMAKMTVSLCRFGNSTVFYITCPMVHSLHKVLLINHRFNHIFHNILTNILTSFGRVKINHGGKTSQSLDASVGLRYPRWGARRIG